MKFNPPDRKSVKGALIMGMAVLIAWPGQGVSGNLSGAGGMKAHSPASSSVHAAGFAGETVNAGAAQVRYLNPTAIKSFYDARDQRPLWTGPGQLAQAKRVLELLKSSWADGLNPARYHVGALDALLNAPFGVADRTRLEWMMSDAVVRYARDMSGMRVDPETVGQKARYWRDKPEARTILEMVGHAGDPARTLAALAPSDPLYARMKQELLRLEREGEPSYASVLPIRPALKILSPGDMDGAVPSLRKRLGQAHRTHDGPEHYYDDRLAGAVLKFQQERGLTPDGRIGPETLAALNRTNRDRMEQLVANMERLRWLDQTRPDRYVLVNIPSQTLWAIEHDRVVLEMPVVVGTPSRQTKSFKTEIRGVRLNPTWTVPNGIKSQDFLPRLREDPDFLHRSGISLYEGHGAERVSIDPSSVNWAEIGPHEIGRFSMVQSPGDHNSLGRYRVLMPNEYDIYLHDTNHPELFQYEGRAFSSGCVRMAKPDEMARFILQNRAGWAEEDMHATLETGRMRDVLIDRPIPVYLLYLTVWLDERGRLVYGPDLYKQDSRLIAALRGVGGYELPASATHMAASGRSSTVSSAAR